MIFMILLGFKNINHQSSEPYSECLSHIIIGVCATRLVPATDQLIDWTRHLSMNLWYCRYCNFLNIKSCISACEMSLHNFVNIPPETTYVCILSLKHKSNYAFVLVFHRTHQTYNNKLIQHSLVLNIVSDLQLNKP